MKYETPAVTVLTPAIDAIQLNKASSGGESSLDPIVTYEDWE
jgi:hypothetical protein